MAKENSFYPEREGHYDDEVQIRKFVPRTWKNELREVTGEKAPDQRDGDAKSRVGSMLLAVCVAIRNVVVGGNLASTGLIGSPQKLVAYVSESLFLYRLMAQKSDLPQVQVWKGLGLPAEAARIEVMLCAEAAEEWFRNVPSYGMDLVSLCTLCRLLRPRVIFEIGTLRGSGALHLAANSPGAEVYTLDLGPSDRPSLSTTVVDDSHVRYHSEVRKYYFSGRPEEQRIHCLFGDSAKFDFSPWEQRVDLFFIDGAHSYNYVHNDTLKALKCCRPGSVLAWHDYGRAGLNGVSKWLHEFRGQGRQIYRTPGGSLAYARL